MRQVLSLSLTPSIGVKIKNRVKALGFDSTSSYIKYLISLDDDLISVKDILKASKEADKEYKTGKVVKAKSIADLL